MGYDEFEMIVSLDENDPALLDYKEIYEFPARLCHAKLLVNNNRSCVDAINNAANVATGDLLVVVSDDSDCFDGWDMHLINEVENKHDFIIKTKDGIQDYIITLPILDRDYYQRTGYIYHPDFEHLFCDTYMTCVADITGRKITSNLLFKHNHYSVGGSVMDEVNKKNDATWKQGEETFLRLMKEFTPAERARIKDPGMKNWLRNKGIV